MMNAESICGRVAAAQKVLPVGAGTKAGLCLADPSIERIDMRDLCGIVAYEPSEYLITVLAGTPVSQVQAALAEKNQYLPFDPLFVSRGSTVGGAVASGVSGPNRLLYGGVRDFVMAVELIDGLGKLVRGGGKVVKNAAGFDLPKLMVGSQGRLGIITEVTLKVFPVPQASATLICKMADLRHAAKAMQRLQAQPLPLAALELIPCQPEDGWRLYARFSGQSSALPNVLERSKEILGQSCQIVDQVATEAELWQGQRDAVSNFVETATAASLAPAEVPQPQTSNSRWLIRAATSLDQLAGIAASLPPSMKLLTISCGGAVAWITRVGNCDSSNRDWSELDQLLERQGVSAQLIDACQLATLGSSLLGNKQWLEMSQRIQSAMDPESKLVRW